jgi:hypothetical protein
MALQYFKVLNAETKQQIDMIYGWDRLDILKKVEQNMADYRECCKVKTIMLVYATDEDVMAEGAARRTLANEVYATAGTAD